MTNFIVVQNRINTAQTDLLLEQIVADARSSVTVIGRETSLTINRNIKVVATEGRTIGRCLAESLTASDGQFTVVANGSCEFSSASVEMFINLSQTASEEDLIWFPTESSSGLCVLPQLTLGSLVKIATSQDKWPVAAIALRPEWTFDNQVVEGSFIEEIFARIILRAVTDGREVVQGAKISISAEQQGQNVITDEMRARLLNTVLENANIEDTFPEHDWENHQSESAAACYHLVAAYFIRLGDMDSAQACLRLGDQLEESPRSLALKAIIARDRGEILGAVANMISSLQQYELRKRTPEPHYVRFAPKNLEVINERLNAGLNALNRRENEHALACFSQAVGSFDSFYEQTGLPLVKS